jgi:hypothetical protein
MKFLRTTDGEERSLIQVLAGAAEELEREADQRRATMIANEVGKLFG